MNKNLLHSRFIGFSNLFDQLDRLSNTVQHDKFPSYNFYEVSDETQTNVLEFAVAGFSEDEITITEENGTLKIVGEPKAQDISKIQYVHKGITTRKFVMTFMLADYAEVSSATLENGILRIEIKRNIPESKKPKVIALSKPTT